MKFAPPYENFFTKQAYSLHIFFAYNCLFCHALTISI